MTSIEITFLKLNRARVVSENAAMHINKASSYIIDNPNFPGFEPKIFYWNLFGFEYHFPVQNHLEINFCWMFLHLIGHLQLDSFVSTALPFAPNSLIMLKCSVPRNAANSGDCQINSVFTNALSKTFYIKCRGVKLFPFYWWGGSKYFL